MMSRDIRNIIRGRCQSCSSCSSFISVSGRVRCDYCGCPPAQHQQLEDRPPSPQQQQQQQLKEKSLIKRSSSNDVIDGKPPSSDNLDDFRSCISEGEMGDDCSGSRVTGFRSNPDLLREGPGARKSKG